MSLRGQNILVDSARDSITGVVFDIQRFSIHDGPGIRTTVFVKGCPLRCAWCHNPEGLSPAPQLAFTPSLCIGCGYCRERCERDGHTFSPEAHTLDRACCIACFSCVEGCYSRALEVVGRNVTVGEIIEEVLKDQPFYEESGGGLTVSGGEPLAQAEFTAALLRAARREGINTCVETSGGGEQEDLLRLAQFTDLFLYDYKETDPARHEQYTGLSNALILENLRALDAAGATIILRCPIISGVNDREDHYRGIAATVRSLRNCQAVHLMNYHRLGAAKEERFTSPDARQPFPLIAPATLASIANDLQSETGKNVVVL